MSSNPLSVGIVSGDVQLPISGANVSTPTIQGAPVSVNRTVSGIMSVINSAVGLAAGVAEIQNRHDKELKDAEEKFINDAERSAYRAEQNKQRLNQSIVDRWNSEINLARAEAEKTNGLSYHSDASKKLMSNLEGLFSDTEIDPRVKAQLSGSYASLVDHAASYTAMDVRKAEMTAKNAKNDFANTLASNMKVRMSEGVDPNTAFTDALGFASQTFGIDPHDTDFSLPLVLARNEEISKNNAKKQIEIEKANRSDFFTAASTISDSGLFSTLRNSELEKPEGFSMAVQANHSGLVSLANSVSTDIAGISQFDSAMSDMLDGLGDPKSYNQQQQNFIRQINNNYQTVRNNLMDRVANRVKIESTESIYTKMGNELITPDTIGSEIADSINKISGVPDGVITYSNGGFELKYDNEELLPILERARHISDDLNSTFTKSAPMRTAMAKLGTKQMLDSEDLKVIGDLIPKMTPVQVNALTQQLPVGGRLNEKVDKFVTDVIMNPVDGTTGNLRDSDLAKAMLIVSRTGYVNAIFEDNASGMDEIAKRRVVMAKAFFDFKASSSGGNVDILNILRGAPGANQNDEFKVNDFLNMLNSVGNPAGGEAEKNMKFSESSLTKSINSHFDSNYTLALPTGMRDYLAGWYKQFKIENPNAEEAMAGSFLNQSLRAVGYSLVPSGGYLRPVRDPNGVLPDPNKIQEHIDAVVDFVPDKQSTLHRDYIRSIKGREATPEELNRTAGMPIWKMDMYLRTGSVIDSRPKFEVDFSMMAIDHSDDPRRVPTYSVSNGSSKGISDNYMAQLFGSGLPIKNSLSNEQVAGVLVNSKSMDFGMYKHTEIPAPGVEGWLNRHGMTLFGNQWPSEASKFKK